jgi:hypothetical protein
MRVSTALKATPGSCSAVPSKSTMSPFAVPFSVSVILSVPNDGLIAGSGLCRWVEIVTRISSPYWCSPGESKAGIAAAEFA